MQAQIKNKNAIVVGATGHLGRAICDELEFEGYTLDETWLTKDHPDVFAPNAFENLPKKIHVAVYCAGLNIVEEAQKLPFYEWVHIIDVNLSGAFRFAQAAFEGLKAAGGGVFITISSINVTHPYPNRVAYAASKAGLEGMTRELAVEWGKHFIYPVCIRLGHLTKLMGTTPPNPDFLNAAMKQTPSGMLIEHEAVARFVAFLGEANNARNFTSEPVTFDPAYTINRFPL